MIKIKAPHIDQSGASNSPAVGKFRNAEIDHFGLQLIAHDFCRHSSKP